MQIPFAKKTVDGVLAGFQKTVDDLRQIVKDRGDDVAKINEKINALTDERAAATTEALRASAVATKLDQLLS